MCLYLVKILFKNWLSTFRYCLVYKGLHDAWREWNLKYSKTTKCSKFFTKAQLSHQNARWLELLAMFGLNRVSLMKRNGHCFRDAISRRPRGLAPNIFTGNNLITKKLNLQIQAVSRNTIKLNLLLVLYTRNVTETFQISCSSRAHPSRFRFFTINNVFYLGRESIHFTQ